MSKATIAVGVQEDGSSPGHIKAMAWRAWQAVHGDNRARTAADIGGGRGEWARQIADRSDKVYLLDFAPPPLSSLPANVEALQTDLNKAWPLGDATVDFAFALEVIEHVENPRHFFRELSRIVAPCGSAFVSTPNNHSLASKLTFLVRGQHRLFQEPSYPAHITPLLACDFQRLAHEVGLSLQTFLWSNYDTLPKLHWRIPLGGSLFSDCFGVLLTKPTVASQMLQANHWG